MISPEVDSSSHRTDEGSLQHCRSHWIGEEEGRGVQGLWGEEIIMNVTQCLKSGLAVNF